MPSGAEITVLDLGYAVEMLGFQVHHAYVLADVETRLPAWLKRRIGQICVGLDVVIEEVGTDDITTAGSLVKERLEAAWREFCERWHGDDHTRLIRGREDTDPECLPENWAKDRSPLNWPAWQALSPPFDRLVSCLPTGFALCFRAGGLLARVEGLDHNEPTQEQIPVEPQHAT